MKSINRLAVILVGELRTWETASKYLFNFFDRIADNVDYFFVTWNVSSQTGELIDITDNDVLAPFQKYNKNIVDYKILEPIGKHRTTFYNQAWLAKVGNILKRKHEAKNNFIYDQVIETRPDCYFRSFTNVPSKPMAHHPSGNWVNCNDFEYEGDIPSLGLGHGGLMGMADIYFRTNSFTNDIIADRYYYRRSKSMSTIVNHTFWGFNNHHVVIVDLFYNRRLKPCTYRSQADFLFFCCVRPNFPKDMDLDAQEPLVLDRLFISYEKQDTNFFYGPQSDLPTIDN